jgi:hypothetical protein
MASQIGRRKFLATLGGAAAAWPLAARAQQPRRVGVLMGFPATDSVAQAYVAAFVQALRQRGWIEGQNLRIDIRWNAGGAALGQAYAALRPAKRLANHDYRSARRVLEQIAVRVGRARIGGRPICPLPGAKRTWTSGRIRAPRLTFLSAAASCRIMCDAGRGRQRPIQIQNDSGRSQGLSGPSAAG